jgi:putative SOS response-associated peptidase YedK
VLEKPAFRNAMRRRRCLIPTDGFYEWQARQTAGPKRPYFIRAKRDAAGHAPPLAFAGLWETWTGPNGEELDTAAIITTAANRGLSELHGRMPVFIAPEAFDIWLDCANVESDVAATLIKPADESLLEVYPVSTAVNRVANDSEMLIAPAPAEPALQAAPASTAAAMAKKPKKAKEPDGQASLF